MLDCPLPLPVEMTLLDMSATVGVMAAAIMCPPAVLEAVVMNLLGFPRSVYPWWTDWECLVASIALATGD
jgi:hypothetical protein